MLNPLDEMKTRRKTAEDLTALGFPVAEASLATWASRGGGPSYRKFGPRPLYRWGDALDWAKARLSRPVKNSSELEAA